MDSVNHFLKARELIKHNVLTLRRRCAGHAATGVTAMACYSLHPGDGRCPDSDTTGRSSSWISVWWNVWAALWSAHSVCSNSTWQVSWFQTERERFFLFWPLISTFSEVWLFFLFVRLSPVTLWTRVLWSGLLSPSPPPTWPESLWSRPDGARWPSSLPVCL